MQITPVTTPVSQTAHELNTRPFRKDGGPSIASFAVHASGEVAPVIYTKDGKKNADQQPPVGYNTFHAIA
ncbi:MAG TPA: hypothetical protein PKI93_05555 [Alphaproteobacteria bacterium]|nr:hypothetical protein [Alphaproteobacteria bacterium]HNS44303.1 hypothetical protein [Alphaproteobacteria bacterium]